MLKIEPATMADAVRLFSWRTDPLTSSMSLTTGPSDFKKHYDWLSATLREADTRIYVARDPQRDQWAGTFRLKITGKVADVGIIVDPNERGKGYASQLIEGAILMARRDLLLDTLVAKVKQSNIPSLRAFWACGFRPTTFGTVMELRLDLTSTGSLPLTAVSQGTTTP